MDAISQFYTSDVTVLTDAALLLVRIVVAVVFISSFRTKISDVGGFAANNGIPVPFAYFLIFAELAGGIGVLLGVLTQIAALGLMLIMLSTMYHHIVKWKSPYWAAQGGWEYDLMIFAMMFVVLTVGGGSYAIKPLPSSAWLPFIN